MSTVATRDFAVSEKQLKIRMKSVGSIGKITKAMKMVSASKMKGDLRRLHDGRDFGLNAIDHIFKADLYMQRKAPICPANPATLLVPITSDKGLCGGVNSAIVKQCKLAILGQDRSKFQIFSIGAKGSVGLMRPFPDCLKTSISGIGTPYNYPTVMSMAVHVQKMSHDSDKIIIIYNEF